MPFCSNRRPTPVKGAMRAMASAGSTPHQSASAIAQAALARLCAPGAAMPSANDRPSPSTSSVPCTHPHASSASPTMRTGHGADSATARARVSGPATSSPWGGSAATNCRKTSSTSSIAAYVE